MPEYNDIQTLEHAIIGDAKEETEQILADAQARAEDIRQQVETQANAKREAILQRAQQEAETLRSHAAAAAQLEAQMLRLKRREQLLERVFAGARQQLASAPQWPDYEQIARRLVREAVERLGADEVLVRADENTRRVLDDKALADLGKALPPVGGIEGERFPPVGGTERRRFPPVGGTEGERFPPVGGIEGGGVRLRAGEPLARGTGVVLETPDGHRRYDNTLETRLARMQDGLRAPVYHILMGEAV